MYREITKCRICGNKNLKTVLNLGMQKLTGVFPMPDEEVGEGPLELVKCMPISREADVCGLVQLRHSCSGDEMYGENYGYRSGLNASMAEHLNEITTEIQRRIEIEKDDLVIDIGSNDSTLLRSYHPREADYLGIDPTGIKFRRYYPEYIELVSDFFSSEVVRNVRDGKKAKVITSIAMFYDLEDPIQFARDIESVLAEDGLWVLEQSYLPSMLKTNSYDTICQEHLEFYSLAQIEWIARRVHLKIIDVSLNSSNGGSFRITAAKEQSKFEISENVGKLQKYEKELHMDSIQLYSEFQENIKKTAKELMDFLVKAKKEEKKVYGYGASTKGNVLLQYCGISRSELTAIAEVNEDKYGHVTPGTNIPIRPESEIKKENPDYFIVLPWHFKNNILEKEKAYMLESGCAFVFPLPKLEIVQFTKDS